MSRSPTVTKNRIRKVSILFGALLCLAATVTHFYLNASAQDATGPLAILDHVFDLVLTVAISFIVLAVGHSLIRRFSLQFGGSAEELTFSFFLGTGVVALSILFIGLLGLLRPWAIITLLLLWIALAARDLPELCRTLARAIRTSFTTPGSAMPAALFVAFIAFVILRTLTPPHVADELIYHLPVPRQFVQEGRISPSYDNSLGNVPFLIHMIYVLCLMARSDIAAKLFSLFLAVGTAISLYAFCRRFITRRVGVLAMFAFFAAGMIIELAVTTRIDVSLAGMLFASTYAMINYLTTRVRRWLWLSALFAGFSLGIKHTAALWILFIGILYLVETIRSHQTLVKTVQLGVVYTVIALAVASPWYIKNAVWFHNPIYPFGTGEVATFGADGIRYFNAEDDQKLDRYFEAAQKEIPDVVAAQQHELREAAESRLARHPMRLWEFFFQPYTYLMAEPHQFPNYLFLIVPFVILLKPTKWIGWLLILSLAFVFSVTLTSWIARYLVPAYPSLTIVAAYTLTALATRLETKMPALARRLPVYTVAMLLATIVAICAASMRQFKSHHFVAGNISRRTFLTVLPSYQPLDFINRRLPQDARVLSIGAQMSYGLERPYFADESWFATKWRRLLIQATSLDDVNQQLKAQGFTHILYNPSLFSFAVHMGVEGTGGMNLMAKERDNPARSGLEYQVLRNWSTFELYKKTYLEDVYSDEHGYEVLRIK